MLDGTLRKDSGQCRSSFHLLLPMEKEALSGNGSVIGASKSFKSLLQILGRHISYPVHFGPHLALLDARLMVQKPSRYRRRVTSSHT
jgi:hypothetical protein